MIYRIGTKVHLIRYNETHYTVLVPATVVYANEDGYVVDLGSGWHMIASRHEIAPHWYEAFV